MFFRIKNLPKVPYKVLTWRWLQLTGDFYFTVLGYTFKIKAGFIFDGASLPFFLWWWVHPHVWWVIAPSLVHDFLYRNYAMEEYKVEIDGVRRSLTRKEIDRKFLQDMCEEIDSSGKRRKWRARKKRQAHIMYLAVRRCGWLFIGDGKGEMPPDVQSFLYIKKYLSSKEPATRFDMFIAKLRLWLDNLVK